MKRAFEVRCCCVPKKLLGWIDVDENYAKRGRGIIFDITDWRPIGLGVGVKTESFELTFEEFNNTTKSLMDENKVEIVSYLALKSNEVPVEKLRRVRGFLENTERL